MSKLLNKKYNKIRITMGCLFIGFIELIGFVELTCLRYSLK